MKRDAVQMDVAELAVLLLHLFRASQSPSIGYNDAEVSLDELLKLTNRRMFVPKDVLERLLYSSNMLDEIGQFWHYKGRSFADFVKHFGIEYDKKYGWIKDPEKTKEVIRYGKTRKKKSGKYNPAYPTERKK